MGLPGPAVSTTTDGSFVTMTAVGAEPPVVAVGMMREAVVGAVVVKVDFEQVMAQKEEFVQTFLKVNTINQ